MLPRQVYHGSSGFSIRNLGDSMKRKRVYLRESHSFPFNWHIGYWDGKSGYPERDFRSCVSLPAGIKWEDAKKEMATFLEKNGGKYC